MTLGRLSPISISISIPIPPKLPWLMKMAPISINYNVVNCEVKRIKRKGDYVLLDLELIPHLRCCASAAVPVD